MDAGLYPTELRRRHMRSLRDVYITWDARTTMMLGDVRMNALAEKSETATAKGAEVRMEGET